MHNPGAHILAVLDDNEPLIWIVVTQTRGSVPREVGASMLVTATGTAGTIGGGHLELKAIEVARARLAAGSGPMMQAMQRHFPLGPALGQCCGGSVEVAFVPVCAADRHHWLRLRDAEQRGDRFVWTLPLDTGGSLTLDWVCAPWCVWVFGAGHVGRALVSVLATLPCAVVWVDNRDDAFASVAGASATAAVLPVARMLLSDEPAHEVSRVPAGADVLVLTHSHALDFEIALALLRRDDLGYVGVIGSGTKAATFRKRLAQRGVSAEAIARMSSPIGRTASVTDGWSMRKHPGVVALSIVSALIEHQQLLDVTRIHMRPDAENADNRLYVKINASPQSMVVSLKSCSHPKAHFDARNHD